MISDCLAKMGIIGYNDQKDPNVPARILHLDEAITHFALGTFCLCGGLLLTPLAYVAAVLKPDLVDYACVPLRLFSYEMADVYVSALKIINPEAKANDNQAIGYVYEEAIYNRIQELRRSYSIIDKQINLRLVHIHKTATSVALCAFRLLFGLFNAARSVLAKGENEDFNTYAYKNISAGFMVIREVALFGLKMINPTCCT